MQPSFQIATVDTAGRYIVTLRSTGGDDLSNSLAATYASRTHDLYRSVFKGFAADLTPEAVRALRAHSQVLEVAPDRVGRPDTTVDNDAGWGLGRMDQRYGPSDFIYRFATTGAGVHLYIIGTGVQSNHSDFGGRVTGGWTYNPAQSQFTPCDNHETAIASIAAGSAFGVARGAAIHPVRIHDCSGIVWESNMVAGFDWVRTNHVKPAIVNFSYGLPIPAAPWFPGSIYNAAIATKNAGVFVVVSAGNNNQNACYYDPLWPLSQYGWTPANALPLMTVAATTSSDQRAGTSNYGGCVDIFAPGQSINAALFTGGFNTNPGVSGTSFAAPFVAGIAALLYEKYPTDSPDQIHYAIRDGATEGVVGNPGPGSPNLFAYSFLPAPVRVTISGPSLVGPVMNCTWFANVQAGRGPFTYHWFGVLSGYSNSVSGSVSTAGWLNVEVWDAIGGYAATSKWIDVDPNNYQVWCS